MMSERPGGRALTMLQVMKLVVFCAVGFACVAPMLPIPHGESVSSYAVVAAFEGIVVPLAWAGLSMVLLRRGPWKDRLVLSFLLCSASIMLVIACLTLFFYTIPNYVDPYPPERRVGLLSVMENVVAILTLAAAACFLAFRLFKRRAPQLASAVDSPDLALERTP